MKMFMDRMTPLGQPFIEVRDGRDRHPVREGYGHGKVVVTGRDRAAFLHGMLTNDIKGLKPGQGCPAAFLDAHGKVKALLCVYALADRLLIELPPGMTAAPILPAILHALVSLMWPQTRLGHVMYIAARPWRNKTVPSTSRSSQ